MLVGSEKGAGKGTFYFSLDDVNRTRRGWFEYFKHSHKWTFHRIDGWLRMRLRSILRKRAGRKGRGRGWDHHGWKNSFFAERGLFNLTAAHALACQSSRQGQPPTGEPCAGDPHARFGGRGGRTQSAFPTPISACGRLRSAHCLGSKHGNNNHLVRLVQF